MTVQATEPLYSDVFVSSGVELEFPFPFSAFRDTDVGVATLAPGAEKWVPLDYGADYTVSRNPAPVVGGKVFLPAPLASGWKLIAYANIEFSQDRKFENQSGLFLFEIEASLDKLTSMAKLLADDAARSPKTNRFSGTRGLELPEPSPGQTLIGRPDGAGWTDGPTSTEIANAETYSNEAEAARDKARQWADDPVDSPVEPGLYSARHHAEKSADSAASAALYDGPWLGTGAALLADTTLFYGTGASGVTAGDIIRTRAEGFAYRVTADGDADYDLATAGGVRLKVLPDADGVFNFDAMIPAKDGVTDDYPKFMRLLAAQSIGSGLYRRTGPTIAVSNGDYFMGNTIELKSMVHIKGTCTGFGDGFVSRFIFPADVGGFVVNRHDTFENAQDTVIKIGADGSVIEGLVLVGGGGTNKLADGIWARARCRIKNCVVESFKGNGIAILAASNGPYTRTFGGSDPMGNANLSQIDTVYLLKNGENGLLVDGYDANAGIFTGVNARQNGKWGVADKSFLGNTHVGHHCEGNGTGAAAYNNADGGSTCSLDGVRYSAHTDATEADLVATVPGTNENVWKRQGTGLPHAQFPLWAPGKPEGTFFHGGAYMCDGANARNVFTGCYSEGGSAGSSVSGPSLVVGGAFGFMIKGSTISASGGGSLNTGGVTAKYGPLESALGVDAESILSWQHADDSASNKWRFKRVGADFRLTVQNTGDLVTFTGENTTQAFGTGTPIPYLATFRTIGLGAGNNARRFTVASTAPSAGNYARGDITFRNTSSAGGKVGWVCTTAGDAGSTAVFKEFGVIDA